STASIASANPSVQAQTRVWDFSSAAPLNVWLERSASPRTHLENQSGSLEPASVSPHAARAAPRFVNPKFATQVEQQLAKDGSKSIFKSLRSLEGRLAELLPLHLVEASEDDLAPAI